MPRIIYGCAAPIAAWMFRHDAPVLADHDALGVGVNVDGAADRAGAHRVFVVVEPDQAGLRHRSRQGVEAVEAPTIGNELRPLFLEHLPDRLLGPLGMSVRFRPRQALVEKPGAQLVVALEPQPRREEALTHEPDLVLDLALLPARRRRADDRFDQVM